MKFLRLDLAFAVLDKDLDLSFDLIQTLQAVSGKPNAFFKRLELILERLIPFFEGGNDFLELL